MQQIYSSVLKKQLFILNGCWCLYITPAVALRFVLSALFAHNNGVSSCSQWKKKRILRWAIQTKSSTRLLTPKLSSSTRKTLCPTQRGSITSLHPSAVSLGTETSSWHGEKDDGLRRSFSVRYELLILCY